MVINKIRAMSVEELAKFLMIYGEATDYDYDYDENIYEYSVGCWYTPFGQYPDYWSEEDVLQETIKNLLKEDTD